MVVSSLPAEWRRRASELEKIQAVVPAAVLLRECANQLDDTLQSEADSVSLKEAAALGGFTSDHIQRLVAKGQLENVGRKGKPRIRRVDVPIKAGHATKLRKLSSPANVNASAIVAAVVREVR